MLGGCRQITRPGLAHVRTGWGGSSVFTLPASIFADSIKAPVWAEALWMEKRVSSEACARVGQISEGVAGR